jgi:hypothetical protein
MLDTRVNGKMIKISVMVKECKSGLMDPCMRAGGLRIKPMAKEDSSMLMEMCTMDSGSMTKLTGLEFIAI